MEGGAHTEVEGGFRRKIEKIKQEDFVSAINDEWLRDWSESADVKVDLGTTKVETQKIKGSDWGENNYEQSVNTATERTELQKVLSINVTGHQRIVGNDIDKLLEALCQDAKLSQRVGNLCKFKCPKCGTTFHSWYMLGDHMKKGQTAPENLVGPMLAISFLTLCVTLAKFALQKFCVMGALLTDIWRTSTIFC